MDADRYDELTQRLVKTLAVDSRVLGLIAVGSMARSNHGPDEWSDHDFWVVTTKGAAAQMRTETDWLPNAANIVVHFAETEHGRSAIYADGHLVEYAIFDDDELEIVSANNFAVLIDRTNIEARMQRMSRRTAVIAADHDPDGADRFGALLAQLTIGICRHARGERLSANHMIRGTAARTLTSLAAVASPTTPGLLDNLDPTRRFERLFPELGAKIDEALTMDTLDCADRLLSLAETMMDATIGAARPEAFAAVRTTIERARAASVSANGDHMQLASIQIGGPKPSAAGSLDTTAIDKQPVASAQISVAGLVGDTIVDTKNHGGPDQAVYVYCQDDYDHWQGALGRELPPGQFGENLTITGISSADVNVGDRFTIGDVVLEAAAARIPCAVFQEHLGETDWVARFRDGRRPGVYCRVIEPGEITAGDPIEMTRASDTISILETQDLYYDHNAERSRLEKALGTPLAARSRAMIERRLAR